MGAYYSELQGDSKFVGQPLTLLPVGTDYQDLASTPVTSITPVGNTFRPTTPTNPSGTIDRDGNIELFWEYSTLYNPFNNAIEAVTYEVEILKPDTEYRLIQSNEKKCQYLIGDRTTDGVSTTLNVNIYGVSSVVGRGIPLVATIIPVELPDVVFSTGGGLRGIRYVEADYTVTENDVDFVLLVQTQLIEEIIVTFPATLSNGFHCYVVNDQNNNRSALATIVVPNSYTFEGHLRIPNSKMRSVTHISLGNYFVEGENSLFYDQVSETPDNGVLEVNSWYEMLGDRTFLFPENPRESDMIGLRGANGVDFAVTPITINGNGELIEGNSTFVIDKTNERIIFYFNGMQWIFITRYLSPEAIKDIIVDFLREGTNITLDYDDIANTLTINSIQLIAGTNITLDYDNVANTLTINSTGGGGGGSNIVDIWLYSG
jgi:hypothetical protein